MTRTRSTQKLPSRVVECRANPRTSAAAIAMPVAAEAKLWITSAKLLEPYTIQVQKTDNNGQPVTTNLTVMVDGRAVVTNMPVMVDQKVDQQAIVQGPMASQVAIKMLGTNGGGYANANAAYPFENPTPLSNFLQMLSIFAIGSGLTWYLGRMTGNQAHGWAV